MSAAAGRFAGAAELVVLNWWVLSVTGEPMMVGIVTAARLVPLVLSGPVAGALADRGDPARLLTWMGVVAASSTMALMAAMALGTRASTAGAGTGAPESVGASDSASPFVWAVVAIIAARSMLTAPEPAVRQLAVARATGDGGLIRGMSDLATIGTLSLIVGPLASGALLAAAGPVAGMVPVLVAHVASAVVVFGAVRGTCDGGGGGGRDGGSGGDGGASGATGRRPRTRGAGPRAALRREPRLAPQIALALGPMLAVFPYTAMIPVIFTDESFGAPGVGAAVGSAVAAVGAVAATLWLRTRTPRDPGVWAAYSAAALAVPVFVAGGALVAGGRPAGGVHVVVALVAFAFLGAIGQIYRTTNRMAVVLLSPPEARGAVLGIASGDRVLIPLGAVACGAIASVAGPGIMLVAMATVDVVLVAAAAGAMRLRGGLRAR